VSYLSPIIPNELIEHLGTEVRFTIVEEVRQNTYFSILLDTTPDLAHEDQMSQVIRYVRIHGESVDVVESFIDFLKFEGRKTAENLAERI
jgi:hypothetical protein